MYTARRVIWPHAVNKNSFIERVSQGKVTIAVR